MPTTKLESAQTSQRKTRKTPGRRRRSARAARAKVTAGDWRQTLLSRLVADMETVPIWERPWVARGLPRNASTGKAYTGLNVLALARAMEERGFSQPLFLTYRQAEALGDNVCEGSKSTKITLFIKREEKDIIGPDGTPETQTFGFCVLKPVFNVEQTTLDVSRLKKAVGVRLFDPRRRHEAADELLRHFKQWFRPFDSRAFYSPTTDVISMPTRCQYREIHRFYSTAFHELTHWTGSRRRLNRLEKYGQREECAIEELTAELGAAFLCASVGLPYSTQHAAYLSSWAKVGSDREATLARAVSQASKAYNFIMAHVEAARAAA